MSHVVHIVNAQLFLVWILWEENRKGLVNNMVQCFKKRRPLCGMIFVSWSCLAADTFASRDVNGQH